MGKIVKNILCVLLSGFIVFSFVGCGDSNKDNNNSAIDNDSTVETEIELESYTEIVNSISRYSLPACTNGTVEVSVYDKTDKENVTVDGNSILPKDKHTYSVTYSLVSNPLITKTIELYFLDSREISLADYSENDEADGETLYTVPACTNGDVVISVFDVTAGESVSMESATTFIPVPCHTYEITYVFSNNDNKTRTITVAFADSRAEILLADYSENDETDGETLYTVPACTNGDVVISVFDVTASESVSMESATTFIPVPYHTYEITYVFSNNDSITRTITVAFADGRVSRLSFHPADTVIPNGATIGDYLTWPTATSGGTLTVQISYGTVASSQNAVTIQNSYAVGNTNITVGDNRWVYFATWTASNEYGSETYVQKFYVAKVAVQEFEIDTPADVTLTGNAELVENISEFGAGNSDYCVKLTGNTATITLNYDITTTGANNQTASLLVVNRGTGTAKVNIYNNAKTSVTTVNMTGEVNSERTIIPFGKTRGNSNYISGGKLTVKVEIECSDGTPEIYLGYFAIGNDCTIETENGIKLESYTKIVKSISRYSLPACTNGTVEVSVYDKTDKENVTVDGNSILPKDKHTYSVTYSFVSNPLITKTIELYFLDSREILLEDYSENVETNGETLYIVPACTSGDVVISVFDVTASESVSMESATTFIPVPYHTYEITYAFSNNDSITRTITVAFVDNRVSKLSFYPADKIIPNGAIIGDYLTWPTATNGGTVTVQISYGNVSSSQNAVIIDGSYGVNKTGQTVGDNRWVYFATWTATNEYGSETYVQKFYVAKVAVQEFEINTPADVTLDGNAELVENISEFGAGNSDYCVKLTGNTATITLNYDITTTGANNQTASLFVVNKGTGTAKVNIYNNAKTSVTTVNMTGEVNGERTIIPFGKTRQNSNYISGGKLTVKVEIECSDGTPEIYLGYFAIGSDCTIS